MFLYLTFLNLFVWLLYHVLNVLSVSPMYDLSLLLSRLVTIAWHMMPYFFLYSFFVYWTCFFYMAATIICDVFCFVFFVSVAMLWFNMICFMFGMHL